MIGIKVDTGTKVSFRKNIPFPHGTDYFLHQDRTVLRRVILYFCGEVKMKIAIISDVHIGNPDSSLVEEGRLQGLPKGGTQGSKGG